MFSRIIGLSDAFLMRGVAEREAALDARVAFVGAAVLVGDHAHDALALHLGLERAADAAIGARGDDAVLGLAVLDDRLLDQRGGRAGLHAGAAGHALGRKEIVVHAGGDVRGKAAAVDGQRERALHLFTGADAARADDALRRLELEVGVRRVLRLPQRIGFAVLAREYVVLALIAVAHFAQADGAGHVLQLAIAVGGAGEAVQRMVGDVELHHALADAGETIVLGRHLDAGRDGRGAGGRRAAAAFDLDEAEATRAERVEAIGGAQLRHHDAEIGGGAHDRRAFRHGDRLAVDLQGHHLIIDGVDFLGPVVLFLDERHGGGFARHGFLVSFLFGRFGTGRAVEILREVTQRAHHRHRGQTTHGAQ